MVKKYKAINFDLDTKELKKIYTKQTKKAFNTAYSDIEKFMLKNNFTHRQGSGYISNEPLSNIDVALLSLKLKSTFPWLLSCSKKIDVTVIEKQFDLIEVMNGKNKGNPVKGNVKNNVSEIEGQTIENNHSTGEKVATVPKEEYDALNKKYNDLLKEYETLIKANVQKAEIINKTNLILNEHLKLKEEFKKAKAETLQRKAEQEKRKGGLNDKSVKDKLPEQKAKPHKPKR
ncbi:MAG: hypothetical protein NC394_00770 [Bacteroides sp.]|nr:hypothetical protein [Bacteroides sp.]